MAQSEEAVLFGTRPGVSQVSLSPDGKLIAYVAPAAQGQGTNLWVASADGGQPLQLVATSGDPDRLNACRWVDVNRLLCNVYMVVLNEGRPDIWTRLIAINADKTDLKMVSVEDSYRNVIATSDGEAVIDWLADESGKVLTRRFVVPKGSTTQRMGGAWVYGQTVEKVDTRTLQRTVVERPVKDAGGYISDDHGNVRIRVTAGDSSNQADRERRYSYRLADAKDWLPLSTVKGRQDQENGFSPVAVDRELNVVYGFDKKDGRSAVYKIALDGSLKRELVFAHPDVDVDGLVRIGRKRRVVGVSYTTDKDSQYIFDPAIKALVASLGKALPQTPLINVVDSSQDESRLLIYAGADNEPGRYYVFDRKARSLKEVLLTRPQLEGRELARMKAVTYAAQDGAQVPGYLTLPPGLTEATAKNLPAIVLPHGGPGARDYWRFDYLSQFFAARGYAVLQPNFRGSTGYGDAWFSQNGIRGWKLAIGDINDGGRWLIKQGIADPKKLAIFGWSYGGYAALQAGVADPDLYKAHVAVAPVTDFVSLRSSYNDSDAGFTIMKDFIGTGANVTEGSPARNVEKLKAPVLIFHGTYDRNVPVAQAEFMAKQLKDAGKKVELVIYPKLDHYLEDSPVRIQMLDKADKFILEAIGLKGGTVTIGDDKN